MSAVSPALRGVSASGGGPGPARVVSVATEVWASPRLAIGGAALGVIALAALAAPLLAPFDPAVIRPAEALRPATSGANLLGTDEFGRDILSRVLFGARFSLLVTGAATILSGAFGTILGTLAAYRGGWIDMLIMRAMDLILAFPAVILAIAVIAFLGHNPVDLVLTIALLYVPGVARTAYSSARTVRYLEYVEAARSIGASDLRVMRLAILPNIAASLIVRITLNAGLIILVESGLSFLGLGPPPPAATLGGMVADARPYLQIQPGYALWPSLAVAVTILALNTFGDGLRDHADPRLRKR